MEYKCHQKKGRSKLIHGPMVFFFLFLFYYFMSSENFNLWKIHIQQFNMERREKEHVQQMEEWSSGQRERKGLESENNF